MKLAYKNALVGAACVALAGALAWLWFDNMEQRWVSRPSVSDAALKNRMLGATRLLAKTGHKVTLANSLAELSIPAVPDGMLIAADKHGLVSPRQGQQLLAWVRRGNTLVTQPRWMSAAEKKALRAAGADEAADQAPPAAGGGGEEDAPDGQDERNDPALGADPIGERLGVRIRLMPELEDCPLPVRKQRAWTLPKTMNRACSAALGARMAQRAAVAPPGLPYKLYLGPGPTLLASMPGAVEPQWSDEHGEKIRVYAEGKGRIVMLAEDYFDNDTLKQFDHGEVLLTLAQQNPGRGQVTIVKHLDALPWYKALWKYFSHALSALALVLALLLWASVRRFGPVLPAPHGARRSLLEHIDASGAWLWKAEGGRQLLLEAAREESLALLRRRAPALMRLPPEQMVATLARSCGVGQSHLIEALQRDASPQLFQFTRQIRTLQILRNHHER